MENNKQTAKKLTGSVLLIILLSFCLCITTFALIWSIVTVDDHYFYTGKVEIDLNGGKPVIEEHEFLFEPGMTVVKILKIKEKYNITDARVNGAKIENINDEINKLNEKVLK